jgi:hypothetical protein
MLLLVDCVPPYIVARGAVDDLLTERWRERGGAGEGAEDQRR